MVRRGGLWPRRGALTIRRNHLCLERQVTCQSPWIEFVERKCVDHEGLCWNGKTKNIVCRRAVVHWTSAKCAVWVVRPRVRPEGNSTGLEALMDEVKRLSLFRRQIENF